MSLATAAAGVDESLRDALTRVMSDGVRVRSRSLDGGKPIRKPTRKPTRKSTRKTSRKITRKPAHPNPRTGLSVRPELPMAADGAWMYL